MKKGDIVRSTGKGKTKSWGNIIGIVVQVKKDRIYVIWSNTYFEDEMTLEEVEPFKISEEVSQLKFSDGMVIHTHGPLRTVEFSNGWYVVGEGKLIPVGSEIEGIELLTRLSSYPD
jgi:hypothetical protein